MFDGPTRAVTFASRASEALHGIGLTMRAGIHTGEVERVGSAARGMAVHMVSRVVAHADQGGIVATQTARDLVLGSGIEFEEVGTKELRGIPGAWTLHRVTAVP